jgi:hypothetical protein
MLNDAAQDKLTAQTLLLLGPFTKNLTRIRFNFIQKCPEQTHKISNLLKSELPELSKP